MRIHKIGIAAGLWGLLQASIVMGTTLTVDFEFKKKAPSAAIVYFSEDKSLSTPGIVDQKNQNFVDAITVAKPGSDLVFKNSDTINHNIFINDRKSGTKLDIGLAAPQSEIPGKISWDEGVFVKMSCKIHPKMRAWIGSISSKYYDVMSFAKKQKKGSLTIEGVPASLNQIIVWMPGYDPISVSVPKGKSETAEAIKKKKPRGKVTLTRS